MASKKSRMSIAGSSFFSNSRILDAVETVGSPPLRDCCDMLASTVAISSTVCFSSTWILWNAFGKESLLDSTAAVRVGKGCCPAWLKPKEARARKTFNRR